MERSVTHENTRDRILALVVERGPVGAGDLAATLGIAAAGVRRHLANLEEAGEIALYDAPERRSARRGRPTNLYVATESGRAELGDSNGAVAREALEFLRDALGENGINRFAQKRERELVVRYGEAARQVGDDVPDRAEALASALTEDGYAASLRRVGNTSVVQLCQGHCPILEAAEAAPELCAAETRAFSTLIGTHVQRISTMADGSRVCTLSIPRGAR